MGPKPHKNRRYTNRFYSVGCCTRHWRAAKGRIIEIYGPESSGKTTVALHAIANVQRAGVAAFIDAEHALDSVYASKLGVDIDALLVSQPDTGEQALEIADTLIKSGELTLWLLTLLRHLSPCRDRRGNG